MCQLPPFAPRFKCIYSLYGLIGVGKQFVDSEIAAYQKFIIKHNYKDSNRLFLAWNVSRLWKYKLDFNMLVVGRKRSSKTSFAYQFVKDLFASREAELDIRKWVDGHVIYDSRQRIDEEFMPIYLDDEGMLTGDRRRSMTRMQVQKTENINFYADLLPINITLIQNFSDLDLRLVDTSTALLLVTRRGEGLLFLGSDALAILKNTFGFDQFIKQPELLDNSPVALKMLRSKASYVFDLTWSNMDDDPLYIYGHDKKKEYQEMRRKGTTDSKFKTFKPVEVTVKQKIITAKKQHPNWSHLKIAKSVNTFESYVGTILRGNRDTLAEREAKLSKTSPQ